MDFDLIPNKPPPGVKIYDEEIEEIEESESSEEEEEPEPYQNTQTSAWGRASGTPSSVAQEVMETPFPISAIATPADIDMLGPSAGTQPMETEEGSDIDEDGLFAGGDDEEESDGMEEVQTALGSGSGSGVKRKLVEEDDYD